MRKFQLPVQGRGHALFDRSVKPLHASDSVFQHPLQRDTIAANIETELSAMANAPNHTTVYIPVGTNGLPLVHTR